MAGEGQGAISKLAARREREAAALKQNLRKRKRQQRARQAESGADPARKRNNDGEAGKGG